MLTNLIIVAFQLLIHTPNPYNSEPSFLQKYVQSCCKSPLDVVEADIKFIELTAKENAVVWSRAIVHPSYNSFDKGLHLLNH